MALRPNQATGKKEEVAPATLPKGPGIAAAPEGYWTPVPKTSDQYGKLIEKLSGEIRKVLRDSGYTDYAKSTYRFQDKQRTETYVEKMVLLVEANYWSYSKQATIEAYQYLINHLKLTENTARLNEDRDSMEFMYEGVLFRICTPNNRFRAAGGYPSSEALSISYGYNDGELFKVLQIFAEKVGFKLDEGLMMKYELKENGATYKEYKINSGMEPFMKLLGLIQRNAPYMYAFSKKTEVVSWLLGSKYIGKSTFDVDDSNNYVGPADYYGSNLYRELVEIVRRDHNGPDVRHTPEMSMETARKYQDKYWQAANLNSFKQMNADLTGYKERKMINSKLPDSLIQEVTGYSQTGAINQFRNHFESKVSDKEDFSFFLLSSSEDTIRERVLAVFRT